MYDRCTEPEKQGVSLPGEWEREKPGQQQSHGYLYGLAAHIIASPLEPHHHGGKRHRLELGRPFALAGRWHSHTGNLLLNATDRIYRPPPAGVVTKSVQDAYAGCAQVPVGLHGVGTPARMACAHPHFSASTLFPFLLC